MAAERLKREGIMLAQPVSEGKVRRLGDSMFAQPKLKGERCRVEWFHNEPVLLSSYQNEFKFLDHIKDALRSNFKYDQIPHDGELYVHGWSFSKIHSAASRKVNPNPDTPGLEFHIFDYQSAESQWQRVHHLAMKAEAGNLESPLVYVPSSIVTPDDWLEQANIYTSEGYEGIILRSAIASYEKKRSLYMLKFKPTEEDDYTICEVVEAISKEGYPKGMVGSFGVFASDAVAGSFFVGAGKLTHAKRVMYWKNREDVIGKTLKVKHEKTKTIGGVPDCSVAVEVIE